MKELLEKSGDRIISLKIKKNSVVVSLTNSELLINKYTYEHSNLYINKILTDEDKKALMRLDYFSKFILYVERLLCKKSYTSKEIKEKLVAKKIKEDCLDEVIHHLIDLNLINDDRYRRCFIEEYNKKLYGINKINSKLSHLGLDEISDYDIDLEKQKIQKTIEKLLKKYANLSSNKKKILINRNLIRLGYDGELIKTCFKLDLDEELEVINIKKEYNKLKVKLVSIEKIIKTLLNKGYEYKNIKKIMEEDLYETNI